MNDSGWHDFCDRTSHALEPLVRELFDWMKKVSESQGKSGDEK